MWEREPVNNQQRRVARGRRSERLACIVAGVVLACVVLTLGSCGGGDFLIGGNVPFPIPSGALPTATP